MMFAAIHAWEELQQVEELLMAFIKILPIWSGPQAPSKASSFNQCFPVLQASAIKPAHRLWPRDPCHLVQGLRSPHPNRLGHGLRWGLWGHVISILSRTHWKIILEDFQMSKSKSQEIEALFTLEIKCYSQTLVSLLFTLGIFIGFYPSLTETVWATAVGRSTDQ